jgi:CHAT domain-containing protein
VLHDVDLGALDLRHLELAVLSSCRGAAGTSTRRMGTASLARALLDRGARAVVGALWDAEDESTAELMAAFHQRYAATRSAVCALRGAQSAMARGSGRARRGLGAWSGFQVLSASPGAERCDPLEGGSLAVAVHQ